MRVSVVLVVIVGLFACGQAFDLKQIGADLVNSLVNKGKDLLIGLGQKLLSNFNFGKRDLAAFKDLKDKAVDLWNKGKDAAKDAFGKAVDKLKALANKFHSKLGFLKDAKDYSDEVDDIVAEHHVQHKRIISDLIQAGKNLLGSVVDKVKSVASAVKAKASELVSGLLQKGSNLLIGKRATLGDHLKTIGGVISKAVSPFKDIIAGVGNSLKGHFSGLVDTVKGHVSALQGKLAGHVSDLKTHGATLLEHGKNALGALSEVVKDILQQTVTNAKPALDGLAKTASSAGQTVLKHFAGSSSSTF